MTSNYKKWNRKFRVFHLSHTEYLKNWSCKGGLKLVVLLTHYGNMLHRPDVHSVSRGTVGLKLYMRT